MNFVSYFAFLIPECVLFYCLFGLYGFLRLFIASLSKQLITLPMFNCYLSDLQAEYREFLTDAASDIAMPWPPLD